MRYCPNGHEVNDVAKFCPKCGAEIHEDIAEEIRFCKKCGNERKRNEKFCSHCGTPFYGDVEPLSDNSVFEEDVHKSSVNKGLLSLILIVTLLLIGGYYLYNHIEEEKRQEKVRIEENERAVEIERKRIEEENRPDNKFYKFACNSDYTWVTTEGSVGGKNGYIHGSDKIYLYFYPKDKESGDVSILTWDNHYSMFIGTGSAKSQYRVRNGNSIFFIFKNKPSGYHSKIYEFEFMLDIVNDGGNVKLVRLDGQEFRQEMKTKRDPFR